MTASRLDILCLRSGLANCANELGDLHRHVNTPWGFLQVQRVTRIYLQARLSLSFKKKPKGNDPRVSTNRPKAS